MSPPRGHARRAQRNPEEHDPLPVHGWTFGFDGTRRSTRSFEEGFGDVCDTTDLRPVAAWERCGLVYVATTDEVSDTAALDSLSMFGADFEALKLDEYTLFREQVSAWPMNWKFPVDSFLETYHVPTLHRGSVAPFYYGTPVLFDARGWNARMCQWRRSTPDFLSEIAADEQFRKHGNLIFFLFPNVILNLPIPGCLEFWHLMPDGRAAFAPPLASTRTVPSSREAHSSSATGTSS